MQIPRLKWDVRRNDQDFNLVHKYLSKVFPHILIPAISSFKQNKKYEPVFLAKRARTLQKFLRGCLRSDEIKSNYVFIQFLSSNEKKEYENVLKTMEKE